MGKSERIRNVWKVPEQGLRSLFLSQGKQLHGEELRHPQSETCLTKCRGPDRRLVGGTDPVKQKFGSWSSGTPDRDPQLVADCSWRCSISEGDQRGLQCHVLFKAETASPAGAGSVPGGACNPGTPHGPRKSPCVWSEATPVVLSSVAAVS